MNMNESMRYRTGEPVLQGDTVLVVGQGAGSGAGTVVYTFDPEKPMTEDGDNDYGFMVKMKSGEFFFWTQADEDISLVSRKA